jgi:hypothetical protein
MIVRSNWSCDCRRSLLTLLDVTSSEPVDIGDWLFDDVVVSARRNDTPFDAFSERVANALFQQGHSSSGFAYDIECVEPRRADCIELRDAPAACDVTFHFNSVSFEPQVPSLQQEANALIRRACMGEVDDATRLRVLRLLSDCDVEISSVTVVTPAELCMISERATDVCIALHELELPALVTLAILDALIANDVRMAAKWDLVTTVKAQLRS